MCSLRKHPSCWGNRYGLQFLAVTLFWWQKSKWFSLSHYLPWVYITVESQRRRAYIKYWGSVILEMYFEENTMRIENSDRSVYRWTRSGFKEAASGQNWKYENWGLYEKYEKNSCKKLFHGKKFRESKECREWTDRRRMGRESKASNGPYMQVQCCQSSRIKSSELCPLRKVSCRHYGSKRPAEK